MPSPRATTSTCEPGHSRNVSGSVYNAARSTFPRIVTAPSETRPRARYGSRTFASGAFAGCTYRINASGCLSIGFVRSAMSVARIALRVLGYISGTINSMPTSGMHSEYFGIGNVMCSTRRPVDWRGPSSTPELCSECLPPSSLARSFDGSISIRAPASEMSITRWPDRLKSLTDDPK